MKFFDYDSSLNTKQHIGLSSYTFHVLKEDYELFSSKNNSMSWNAFLNQLLQNYRELKLYPADFNHQYEYISAEFADSLLTIGKLTNEQKDRICQQLRQSFINGSKKNMSDKKSDTFTHSETLSKAFNLQYSTADALYAMQDTVEADIFIRPGKYIVAIFDEYAKKPFVEREEIVFYSTIKTIKESIENNRCIAFKHINNETYTLLPYTVRPDTMGAYLYLAGKVVNSSSKNIPEYIASFRLSRISNVRKLSKTTIRFNEFEKEDFEKTIKEKGIQFLIGETVHAVIRFTPNGLKMYNSQLHRRPRIANKINNDTFEFFATKGQLEFYFFSFGPDVEILEPAELRNHFINKYKAALSIYTE